MLLALPYFLIDPFAQFFDLVLEFQAARAGSVVTRHAASPTSSATSRFAIEFYRAAELRFYLAVLISPVGSFAQTTTGGLRPSHLPLSAPQVRVQRATASPNVSWPSGPSKARSVALVEHALYGARAETGTLCGR
jgi:hypothetical protein